ncbi:MAG TPA: membrane protein insertase YidC [Treponema sp.]|nr:membrane protein insertase YidC [Treponema sp.]
MEKNTVLAVVLSIVVLVGFYLVQGIIFPPQPIPAPATQTNSEQTAPVQPAPQPAGVAAEAPSTAVIPVQSSPADTAVRQSEETSVPPPQAEERITVETDLLRVVLSSAGGDVVSWKLKDHDDQDDLVEMVFSGNKEGHAFTVSFDSIENMLAGKGSPVSNFFHVKRISDYSVEFYQDFVIPAANGGEPGSFRLIKRYEFKPGEYMFELNISLDGGFSTKGFNFNGAAYTLAFDPQIGPRFEKLDQRSEFRQYLTYTNNKVKQEKTGVVTKDMPAWAAIAGKYFTLIAVPYAPQFRLAFSEQAEEGIPSASRMFISRSDYAGSRLDDRYLFYLGPKSAGTLSGYYNGKNGFNVNGLQIADAAKTRSFLSIPPLESALNWLLLMFYKLVPNYGVAIILLTLLVKIIFFPLTKKSSEATLRMQTLSPKIKELQTKYKDNPQKMNAEMAELYKKEGYNPLSGCLPMLLQIPIFFAMYNLFNSHFDLRGAMFIPGWIPDLSLPEAIWNFPGDFRLPLLGWTAIRALPFIYVGSQLLYGKFTQTPDQQGNTQMKMMLYIMPIIFFFVLYDVPSGLLIYWIFSNILTLVQQVIINKYMAPKRAALANNPEPVIAPKKKKRR